MSETAETKSQGVRPVNIDRAIKLGAAVSRHKARASAAEARVAELEKTVQSLTGERDTLKVKADTSLASKRVEELTAQMRDMKHQEAFTRVAASKGVRPDGIPDLWQLSGYKAEADEIDEAALSVLIDDQKAKRPYLFGESKGGDPISGGNPSPVKPGPASGQGNLTKISPAFTEEQLNDPGFVMKNWAKIQKNAAQRVEDGQV